MCGLMDGLRGGLSELSVLSSTCTQVTLTAAGSCHNSPLPRESRKISRHLSLPFLGVSGVLVSVAHPSPSLHAHPAPGQQGSHRQVLEQPGSHDVGGHLGEDPPLLVSPSLLVQVLIFPTRTGRGHAGVQPISLVTGVVTTLGGQAPAGWTWGPQMYRPAILMVSNPYIILENKS